MKLSVNARAAQGAAGAMICAFTLSALPALGTPADPPLPAAHASASAESLFQEGRALTEAGDIAGACLKFEASQSLEPTAGTLINLADCHEKLGKTATAWAEFLRVAAMARAAGQGDREQVARDRARALEAKLVRLRVVVAPEAAIEGLVIERAGVELPQATWGSPIPVDPGEYVVQARAPGRETFSARVLVDQPGGTVTVTIDALAPAAPAPSVAAPAPSTAAPPAPATAAPVAPAPAQHGVDDESDGSGQRTLGLVLGGAGIAGLAAGGVFGLLANDSWRDAKDAGCGGGTCPTTAAQNSSDDANSQALVASVCMGAGGALLAAGLIVYLVAPEATEPAPPEGASLRFTPLLGKDTALLSVGGRFE